MSFSNGTSVEEIEISLKERHICVKITIVKYTHIHPLCEMISSYFIYVYNNHKRDCNRK